MRIERDEKEREKTKKTIRKTFVTIHQFRFRKWCVKVIQHRADVIVWHTSRFIDNESSSKIIARK